jgi:peptidoglycan/LPS O-acetylase OafA/YrhL
MKRLNSIQSLRAVAASLVVFLHIRGIEELYGDPTTPLLNWFEGAFGVDIFFVISGFIMVYVTYSKPSGLSHAGLFLTKRIIRVVPAYWFYTFVMVLLLLVVPQAFRDTTFDLVRSVKSLFFIPQDQLPIHSIGWTLNYEMYFYLLFALFLLLPRKALLPGISVLFVSLVVLGRFLRLESAIFRQISDPIVLEFVFGMYIGYFFLRDKYLPKGLAWTCAALGASLIVFSFFVKWSGHRILFWGVPAGLIVLGASSLERNAYSFSGTVSELGNSSYSLYLSHPLTLFAVGKVLAVLHLSGYLYNAILITLAYAASVIVGIISFRAIEKTSSRYLIRRFVKRNLSQSGAATRVTLPTPSSH